MMNLDTIKKGLTLVVSIGVSAIINNAIKANTPSTVGILSKICIIVGGVFLSGAVCEKVVDYTEKTIDKTLEDVKERVLLIQ